LFILDGIMAEMITALKVQKRRSDRINVFLEGEYAFSVPAIMAVELKVGQALSKDEAQSLQEKASQQDAYERALNQISRRPRSCREIERYLSKRGFDPTVIVTVIDRLVEKDYLNDRTFAELWVENRFEFRPRGARALRAELFQKGLTTSTIEAALENYDEREAALRAGKKAARRWQKSDEDEFHKRVSGYLTRRGFEYELVRKVVSRMWDETAASSNESEGSE
jgi:regulatory protein